MLYTVVIELQ